MSGKRNNRVDKFCAFKFTPIMTLRIVPRCVCVRVNELLTAEIDSNNHHDPEQDKTVGIRRWKVNQYCIL